MNEYELETIEVSGNPRQLGESQGEALRGRIQRFVAMRFDSVDGYFRERAVRRRYFDTLQSITDALSGLQDAMAFPEAAFTPLAALVANAAGAVVRDAVSAGA